MINTAEIIHGVTGAWRIAMRDPDAARHFDLSERGFRHSFFGLALALPVLFLTTTSLWHIGSSDASIDLVGLDAFTAVQLGGTVLYWAIYLAVMSFVARHLELGASYVPYVIVFNWGTLMTSTLFALPLLLYALRLLDPSPAVMLTLPAFAALVWYRWQIARQVLGASPSSAAAILILDFAIGVLMDQGIARLAFPTAGVSS